MCSPRLPGPAALLAATVLSAAARADVIVVPTDEPTIQGAILAASPGDTVQVLPGTYVERLDFLGKDLRVASTQGAAVTVVDASGVGSVVTFAGGESRAAVLEGFTLRNGVGTARDPLNPYQVDGAGILVDGGASPTIRDNVVEDNENDPVGFGGGIFVGAGCAPWIEANVIRDNHNGRSDTGYGGGVAVVDGSPVILGNTIEHNDSGSGGGIGLWRSDALIEDNVIHDNSGGWGSGGGIDCWGDPGPVIRHNRITGNSTWEVVFPPSSGGGGICCASSALIEGNTILDNDADHGGGGILLRGQATPVVRNNVLARNIVVPFGDQRGGGLLVDSPNVDPVLVGNTVVDNQCGNGGGIYLEAAGIHLNGHIVRGNAANPGDPQVVGADAVWWSDVEGGWGGAGGGNLDADPRFVDPAGDDYRLQADSPCVDARDPCDVEHGVDAEGMPRQLDGDLDRVMVADMGAHEFAHVRLSVQGGTAPGDRLTVRADGTPGLVAVVFVGTGTGEWDLRPYGALLLQDLAGWWLHGVLPAERTFVEPPGLPAGAEVTLQALALKARPRAGNLSNAVTLVLE